MPQYHHKADSKHNSPGLEKWNQGTDAGVKIKCILLIDEDNKQRFLLRYTSPLKGGRDTLHQKMHNPDSVVSLQILVVKRIVTLLLLLFLTNGCTSPDPWHTVLNTHLISFPFFFFFIITGTLNGKCWGRERGRRGGEGHSSKYNVWTTSYHR